jgi:hypothetical protein
MCTYIDMYTYTYIYIDIYIYIYTYIYIFVGQLWWRWTLIIITQEEYERYSSLITEEEYETCD